MIWQNLSLATFTSVFNTGKLQLTGRTYLRWKPQEMFERKENMFTQNKNFSAKKTPLDELKLSDRKENLA